MLFEYGGIVSTQHFSFWPVIDLQAEAEASAAGASSPKRARIACEVLEPLEPLLELLISFDYFLKFRSLNFKQFQTCSNTVGL